MMKSCFLGNILAFLMQCGFGRGKLLIFCGKNYNKLFHKITLAILIYIESIETRARKRQVIQLFSTEFLKI